ncbi:PAS domain-containing protein [Halorubellus sp. JP-L1]|uniref:sensor histidine kinase n=1 Tax=Halorubellus sp. JP-L1 TaxID=2715753 RepID=UPI00140C145C|nr:PAS domain-containing sensor histidine kinase [Halorubellus sp. JP-L1]NHN42179.1 PAS domain-containing protein [Halorubellus sp. JP-L1]
MADIVCTGARSAAVADRLAEGGVAVEHVPMVAAAVERAREAAGVVLAVDAGEASVVERVREAVPERPVVVVAASVDAAVASAAVAANVTALVSIDDDVVAVVEDAVDSMDGEVVPVVESDDGVVSVDAGPGPDVGRDLVESGATASGDWRGLVVDRLFESSPDRLVVVGADGTVVRANDRAREAFEISIGETSTGDVDVYDTDGEFVPPEARPWARVFRTGEASYGHQLRIDPDVGEPAWFVVDVVPLGDGPDAAFASFRDVTDDERARERREQLEHERERLEYVNRLLRHNLLNSLNVAHARTNLLEGHVDDEVEGHLETASSRLDEMIDFVETMRSLMHILVEDDNDSDPISLERVLDAEVAKLREAYDVDVHAEVPSIAVAADELLPEVFENLLLNAVQHNDADQSAVFVDVDVDESAGVATVSVADNGPGVDPSMREELFEKGEKGFDSPGTGFGLYLVRETVDAYGGDVELVDDDHTGATFAVTLPLADGRVD